VHGVKMRILSFICIVLLVSSVSSLAIDSNLIETIEYYSSDDPLGYAAKKRYVDSNQLIIKDEFYKRKKKKSKIRSTTIPVSIDDLQIERVHTYKYNESNQLTTILEYDNQQNLLNTLNFDEEPVGVKEELEINGYKRYRDLFGNVLKEIRYSSATNRGLDFSTLKELKQAINENTMVVRQIKLYEYNNTLQYRRMNELSLPFNILSRAYVVDCEQYENKSEFTFFGGPTQIGTIAKREFYNENQNRIKTIYYTAPMFRTMVMHEDDAKNENWPVVTIHDIPLRPRDIETYEYDDNNNCIRVNEYNSKMELQRYKINNQDGFIYYNNTNQRTYEYRDSIHSHIYYDKTGESIQGFRGGLPKELESKYEWGKPVSGLQCRLIPCYIKHPINYFFLLVQTKNVSDQDKQVVNHTLFEDILIVLRDTSGKVIPQDEDYNNQKLKERGGDRFSIEKVLPNQCVNHEYQLDHWYPNLTPGKYSLSVKRQIQDKPYFIPSNEIQFEILEKK
jgi:hypothetical protein